MKTAVLRSATGPALEKVTGWYWNLGFEKMNADCQVRFRKPHDVALLSADKAGLWSLSYGEEPKRVARKACWAPACLATSQASLAFVIQPALSHFSFLLSRDRIKTSIKSFPS
ncbi:hypothetical protein CEXT_114601 [Caerostris extrusa]|uniref:Uncharacterized protein n=1 Tax=Caerostris extrusa TaxID=172846 RepID=A0AAV4X7U4_CAEEX|nr:hypothetical protein CEXT_114601 [Caerostris extrusa]